MTEKISVDELTEKQMKQVRAYLGKLPNKIHRVRTGVLDHYECGNYVHVDVDKVEISVDSETAKLGIPTYQKVTFFAPLYNIERSACGENYDQKISLNETELKERRQVIKGLVSLLGSFVIDCKK